MAPAWLDFCVLAAGREPVRRGNAFRYLELGCGQGYGLCLLAAANSQAEFVGVDFQPEHILHARSLAKRAGLTNVRFAEADFADVAEVWPKDFGTFDYVTLHGILTWVSPELRRAAVRCLEHGTHAGSLIYASYNAQPSWLGSMPFQHIARLLKKSSAKASPEVIEDSISLFERLRSGKAAGFQMLPALDERLRTLRSHDPNYLVHEYLNESWQPLWHSEVAAEMACAGLSFAGSATVADNLLPDVLPQALRAPILEQASAAVREDLQDFAINQGFRRDIFSRGALAPLAQESLAEGTTIYLVTPPQAGRDVMVRTSFGGFPLQQPAIAPILEKLTSGPANLRELAGAAASAADLREILILLLEADIIGIGPLAPGKAAAAQRMNKAIASAVCGRAPYEQLAASSLGSAIRVSQIEMLILDAWLECGSAAEAIAEGVAARMGKMGQGLYHHGRPVAAADAAQQLRSVAAVFLQDILPRWRQLGVVA
jgi:SAM-dependent methyltransferase